MIVYFENFLNDIDESLKEGDRVIMTGTIEKYTDEGRYNIDIEDKSGIIVFIKRGACPFYGIVFDNYLPYNVLNDLDRRIKMNRGYWIQEKRLKKLNVDKKDKVVIKYSDRLKPIFEYVEYIQYPIYANISYIDITDRNDTISFLSKDRIERLSIWNDMDMDSKKLLYSTPLRQEMKISRFIQLINPYTDKISLDRKINIYKSAYNNLILSNHNFKIVSGEDIRFWYNEINYYPGSGTLNKSCMRNSMDRLDVYCKNPDKIKLLIMIDENNKLLGRSLIWKVDIPDCFYLDRAYTVFQEDEEIFDQYAIEREWKYFKKEQFNTKMYVFLNKDYGSANRNPFMDTFYVFCYDGPHGKNYLSNTCSGCKNYDIWDYV